MPSVRIRPTKQFPSYKRIAVTGAGGSASTAVNDSNDETYIRRAQNDAAPTARFALQAPTVPAGSDIATIVPGGRFKQPTSRPPKLVTLAMSIPGKVDPKKKSKDKYPPTINGPSVRAGDGTSPYTFAAEPAHGAMAAPNGPWENVLKKLHIRVNDGHEHDDESRAYIYELFADVYYAARPTCSLAVGPESPVTSSSYPEITLTATALVESWQDNKGKPTRTEVSYELKVFDDAVYLAQGFDPETSPCVWRAVGLTAPLDYGDGLTPSSENVVETPDNAIPNGTYKAYARGRRTFKSAEYGDWASLIFGINVAPPPAPTLAATLDPAAYSVTVSVTPHGSAGAGSPVLWVDRSDDGGATWTPVRGAEGVAATFEAASVFTDHEAPRGAAVQYRAACEADFSGLYLISDWAACAPVGTIPVTGWNLKVPEAPALNWLGAAVAADPEWTQDEQAAVFRPVGRKFPVVVSMSIGGADGSMQLSAGTDAEWAKLEAIRDHQGALLLESPYGWSRYIRLQGRSWTESGPPAGARRSVSVSFLEIDRP